jgi:hypothetical protein
MKNKIKINSFKIVVCVFAFLVSGCSEYFENPLEDKETGENINLLIVDFNFFNTRMTYKLIDAKTGEIIRTDAKIKFTGNNANDIVSYAGEKSQIYQTAEGQLELTIDPNVKISSNSPFDFAVNVEINGYNSLSKGIIINSEGIKTFELLLLKKTDGEETELTGDVDLGGGDTIFHFMAPATDLKSLNIATPHTINHSFSIDDLMLFRDSFGAPLFVSKTAAYQAYLRDPDNFIKVTMTKFPHYEREIDVVNFNGDIRSALFHKLETGTLTKFMIDSKVVSNLNGGKIITVCGNKADFLPLILGFVKFENNHWNQLGDKLVNETLNFSYTLATISDEELCQTGSTIIFNSSVISSFSIDANVFDANNNFITSMTFKGSFPDTFLVENVPAKAVKLVFRNNNPAFNEITSLEIANFCSGNYNVNVSPASGYQEFQIVLKAMCRNNPEVAIAPTYSAEVKLKNEEIWQGINMKGGVVDVLGKPNEDYEIRLLWNNTWEYTSYSTTFDANGNYTGIPGKDTKVKSEKLNDGRIRISVEQIFDQNICDDMGW